MVYLGESTPTHGNTSRLTATAILLGSKLRRKYITPAGCISSHDLYKAEFPSTCNCLGPPDAAMLISTKGNKIMMAGYQMSF